MALATLSIDFVAQLAKFEADMGRAARVAEVAANRIERGFGGTGAVFKGSFLANEVSNVVRQLSALVPALVTGVANFQDLEEKTGASAEALASFTTAGDVASLSADQLAGFMVKLTGTLSKTNDETKGAGLALKSLGLDLEAFRDLAPEEQFKLLAERLEAFGRGGGKTAAVIALLGKSGADALPFLKELATAGLSQNRLTAEQIRLADDLVDSNARVRSELKQAAQVAALQALPAFNALVGELVRATTAIIDIDGAADKLGGNSGIRSFAEDAATGLAVVADAAVFANKAVQLVAAGLRTANANRRVAQVFVGDPRENAKFITDGTGPLKDALDERNAAVAESDKRLRELLTGDGFAIANGLKNRFATARLAEQAGINDLGRLVEGANAKKPQLKFSLPDDKAQRDGEQLRKARLESALKDLESVFASERDAVQFQQRFLDAQYQQGLLGIADFYSQRRALDERALNLQLGQYKQEADALRDALARPNLGAIDREKTGQKLREVEARAALERQQFGQQAKLSALEEARAYDQAAERVIEFRAQVLELQGDLERAAKLRADLAIKQAQASSASLGLSPADLQSFESATRASLAFGAAQRRVQSITTELSIAEQRIAVQAEASGAGRAEVEQRLFALRSQALAQLGEQLRKTEELAAAAGPDSPAVQFARQLRLEFERLSVSVDPALTRLRQVGDEVANALGQAAGAIAINFKDAKSAVASLGDALLRISTRELIEIPAADFFRSQIRQVSEGNGGIGQAVRNVFGVGARGATDGATGAAAALDLSGVFGSLETAAQGSAASLSGLSQVPATLAINALAAAAQNAALALGALGGGGAAPPASVGSSLFDFAGDLFIKAFGLSEGGYTGPGPRLQPAGVVHKGEVVWSQPDVARVGGPAAAEAIRLGLRGYAEGGVVQVPRVFRGTVPMSAPAAASGGGRSRGGDTFVDLRGLRVDSRGTMDRMAEERSARNIARTAERYLSRRGA